ncbi:MAG: ATP-binding protein [Anaerolineae bacterium]|nr:ATP-binding protein [Anaerolineae bacterium]MDW8173388.1 ATP-binding protein [Anaerolineae bacterium]
MDANPRLQPTIEDLELLARVSQLLNEVDLDKVLSQVIGLAAQAVGATKASLFLHEGGQVDWNHVFTMRDLSASESVRVVSRVLHEGFAGWVYRNKKGDIIYDTQQDARWIVFPNDKTPVRSALCVPFISDDHVLAVVTFVHDQPRHFTPYHLRFMTIIANQATIAIRNAQSVTNLSAQRRQLQSTLDSIADALFVLDELGHIIHVNPTAVALLGERHSAQVVGYHLSRYLGEDSLLRPVLEIIEQRSDESMWRLDTRSDRQGRDYQVTMSQWEEPLRGIRGYVVVMHDVTTLRDLHRFKDEMLHIASHDLRSPLSVVTGYVNMIALDTPDPNSPVHEYVDIIKRNCERMSGLIDDILRVERIKSSPLELHAETDIEALVKVVLVNMRPSAESKKQRFEAQINLSGVPHLVADPVLIRQAMENLVGNAIKYTPEGGLVRVYAGYDDRRFTFVVQDSGIGIAPEHQPYVWEAFYRVPQSVAKEKGHGLGLSLVRNVIARHNGEVTLQSSVGKGSRFGFWLPLHTPPGS